jgi:hypothetical protein
LPAFAQWLGARYMTTNYELEPSRKSGETDRTRIVIVAARSGGRKIFGLATLNVRFR